MSELQTPVGNVENSLAESGYDGLQVKVPGLCLTGRNCPHHKPESTPKLFEWLTTAILDLILAALR